MIDTLMVLWTRGICNRLLQTLATFLCLFTGICVLLFLVTASGVKWQGLAISITPTGANASTPAITHTATPVPAYIGPPPILQNPTPRPRIHHSVPVVPQVPLDVPTATPDTSTSAGGYGGYQTLFP